MKEAQDVIMGLWAAGYAATDIIQTLFKVYSAFLSLFFLLRAVLRSVVQPGQYWRCSPHRCNSALFVPH
jgi:hypothetical protein